jgi:hypothetical protein
MAWRILLFRGKQATSCREQWRQCNGELAIPLDKYGHYGKQLRIVRQYKHLGTVVDALGVAHANSIECSKAALAAYAPIAMKVFGSELIDQAYKMSFVAFSGAQQTALQCAHFSSEVEGFARTQLHLHEGAEAHLGSDALQQLRRQSN